MGRDNSLLGSALPVGGVHLVAVFQTPSTLGVILATLATAKDIVFLPALVPYLGHAAVIAPEIVAVNAMRLRAIVNAWMLAKLVVRPALVDPGANSTHAGFVG